MAFKDLFLPKLAHPDPEKRKQAVKKEKNIEILKRVIEKDDHPEVIDLAKQRITELRT
jgi:hypothetical protein